MITDDMRAAIARERVNKPGPVASGQWVFLLGISALPALKAADDAAYQTRVFYSIPIEECLTIDGFDLIWRARPA